MDIKRFSEIADRAEVLRACMAEIERLEGEVRLERGLRAQARLEYDSVIRAMKQQLDAYTDRLLAAGLMM